MTNTVKNRFIKSLLISFIFCIGFIPSQTQASTLNSIMSELSFCNDDIADTTPDIKIRGFAHL